VTHGTRPRLPEGSVRVPALARVEGEGGLEVVVRDGRVVEARLDIYEPPRFFEALLRGRRYTEPPDITARICGICPIAYQMSSVQAIEDACDVAIPEPIRALRRLIYCGEWIESHALHVYLLHAPDYLGFESGIHLAREHPDLVERGLRLKRAGNRVMEVIGGRSVHPVNVRVGGFYRSPTRSDLRALIPELEWARDAALETVRWVATFPFQDFDRDYQFVSLRDPVHYPITEGRVVSNRGLDVTVAEFDGQFVEEHVPHSNALHSHLLDGSTYFVGPMARYSLNADRLSPVASEAARDAGLGPTCTNPFRSIVVRSVELLYAVDEALRLVEGYEPPDPPFVEVTPRAALGFGCTEAPRGILFHRYRLDDEGSIIDAKIVPPTSQNQAAIEADLRDFVQERVSLPPGRLTWECEQAVRAYDPCISCATHFLDLRMVNE
jgi:coenzyme F420-reducing hydrogenase alpha subunit